MKTQRFAFCFPQRERALTNGNSYVFENSLDSGYPFASVPAAARRTKTMLLETLQRRQPETVGLWHNCAIFQCRFSFVRRRWEARFDAHLIAKSSKFVRCELIRGQRWIVKRRQSYAFSHRGAHFCLRGGWGTRERFDVAARNEPPKHKLPKPQTATVAAAQRNK